MARCVPIFFHAGDESALVLSAITRPKQRVRLSRRQPSDIAGTLLYETAPMRIGAWRAPRAERPPDAVCWP